MIRLVFSFFFPYNCPYKFLPAVKSLNSFRMLNDLTSLYLYIYICMCVFASKKKEECLFLSYGFFFYAFMISRCPVVYGFEYKTDKI